ncbi:MCE family protein [Pseudonocardia sp. 73-21]|uniref:MCE family protein n=1 Tax=Pseudonocardia sp. 73-21 TaxID=1895809 RepID=UPI000962556B|nr:MCE family protein [Pseudonocardia sp. 73-21]OJY52541.1 MAG: ABC transporter substrate-binding protein [Pseudonocardia sp. 73-21]
MSRVPLAPLIKFLVFAVVTALATTVLALTIANAQGTTRANYSAMFTDASGLLTGDDVRIAGVVVGSVDKVEIADRTMAKVDFSVDSTQALPSTVTASILYKNLIGQRFLSLAQGTTRVRNAAMQTGPNAPAPAAPSGRLAEGATIPVDRTTPPLNLTTLFNGFQPLFTALDPQQVNTLSMEIVQVLQGQGGTVENLLASTSSLTNTIADRDQVVGQVIDNLNSVLGTINSRDDQLSDLITSLQRLVSGLAQDRKPIGQAIASVGDLTQVTAGFLDDARAPLKQDIAALGRLSTQLDIAKPTLQTFLTTAPGKLNTISRAASYGSWFQFYVCGLSGSVGIGGLVPAQNIPLFKSDAPRCGADPSGSGGQSPPLLPGLPSLPAPPTSLPQPSVAPVLPLLGGG